MSEVGLVPFEESQNSPLFQNNDEDAKHDLRLVSARETENRSALPRCIPASTVFRVGGIDDVSKQISGSPLLPLSALKPLVSDVNASTHHRHSLSAPVLSIADMLSRRRHTLMNREKGRQPAMIESARFPRVGASSPAPLPGGLGTVDHLENVTSAQSLFASKPSLKRSWEEWFYSTESQHLFLDCFWWMYLEKFQQEKKEEHGYAQKVLFDRMSDNYVALLCKPVHLRYREPILKVHCSVLCQAVYSAFVQCFSISWRQFDEKFKVDLCNTIFLWLVGTRPIPDRWKLWDYSILDPPNEFKMIAKEDEGTAKDKTFNLDRLLAQCETSTSLDKPSTSVSNPTPKTIKSKGKSHITVPASKKVPSSESPEENQTSTSVGRNIRIMVSGSKSDVDVKKLKGGHSGAIDQKVSHQSSVVDVKEKSPSKQDRRIPKGGWKPSLTGHTRHSTSSKSYTVGETLEFQQVLFDIYGHSPMVQHFLRKRDLVYDKGLALLFKRTEISSTPVQSGLTYQEQARESEKRLKSFEEEFDRHYHAQKRKIIQYEKRRAEENIKYRKNLETILARKKDVSRLCQFLTIQLLSGDQHKPMKSRQVAITEYLTEELEGIKALNS